MKKLILLPLFFLIGSLSALAQDPAPPGDPLLPVYLVMIMVAVVFLLTLTVAIIMLSVLNTFIRKAAEEDARKRGLVYVPPQSAWEKFWERVNAMRPIEEEKDLELDHDYDGIRELDNHLPPWWKGLFYGCIVFAVVYMVAYHFSGSLPLSGQEYEDEVAQAREQARIRLASQPAEVVDESTLTYTADEAIVSSGKQLFVSNNCQSCHRNDGGGNTIGPNLTDQYWLHGGDIKKVFATIRDGVVEKAMPAWGKVMSQKDVRDLAFYVMSLQGTNPENAKKPQGELYKPEPAAAPADTTKISMTK